MNIIHTIRLRLSNEEDEIHNNIKQVMLNNSYDYIWDLIRITKKGIMDINHVIDSIKKMTVDTFILGTFIGHNEHSQLYIVKIKEKIIYLYDPDDDECLDEKRHFKIPLKEIGYEFKVLKICPIQEYLDDIFCLFHCLRIMDIIINLNTFKRKDIQKEIFNYEGNKITYDDMIDWITKKFYNKYKFCS